MQELNPSEPANHTLKTNLLPIDAKKYSNSTNDVVVLTKIQMPLLVFETLSPLVCLQYLKS